MELTSLIFFIFVLAHIVAILYHGLGYYEVKYLDIEEDTWFHKSKIVLVGDSIISDTYW